MFCFFASFNHAQQTNSENTAIQTGVVDLHNDRSFFITAKQTPFATCQTMALCAANYKNMRFFFSLWRPNKIRPDGKPWGLNQTQILVLRSESHFDYLLRAIQDLKETKIPVSDNPEDLLKPESFLFLGVEGAYLLNNNKPYSILNLRQMMKTLKQQKVSYITLTWSEENDYAGAHWQTAKGLTEKGKQFIRLSMEFRILIDLSHASEKTVLDFYRFTKGKYPLFFSHSSVQSIHRHSRNVSDSILKKIQETQGLIGINFYTKYLNGKKTATLNDVVRHIEKAVQIAGYDYVALGSDFDGFISLPDNLQKAEHVQNLIRELYSRNWTKENIAKLLYQNVYRVLKKYKNADG